MTCCSRRPALEIQIWSFESSASRYSCCVSLSSKPGKKSRAIIWDSASVYVSSSMTFFGRLMRFVGGGGGISSVSALLRTRALDGAGSDAMAGTAVVVS